MDFVENSRTLRNGSHVFGSPIYAHFFLCRDKSFSAPVGCCSMKHC